MCNRGLVYPCCRYQQIAAATFDVQRKQQYLKQLAAEAESRQAGINTAAAAAGEPPSSRPLVQQPLDSQIQHSNQQQQQLQPPHLMPQQALGSVPLPGQQQQPLAAAVMPSLGGGQAAAAAAGGGGMLKVLEGTAQEVFRVLLFVVFTLEVYIMSLLPFVGR